MLCTHFSGVEMFISFETQYYCYLFCFLLDFLSSAFCTYFGLIYICLVEFVGAINLILTLLKIS